MPIAVGSSIATVAVLETNADSRQVINPNAMTTRAVEPPTHRSDRMNIANRRATPCLSMAAARMNAPMKVNTVVDPNGASASSAGTTPRTTIAPTPMSPPTGIGTGSVIHRTMTPSSTAASRCWSRGRPKGSSAKTTVTTGARNSPTVRRPFSNRSSAGLRDCSPRLR
jgi:hypothetical protein